MKATYDDLCEVIHNADRPDLCVFWASPAAFRELRYMTHEDGQFLVEQAMRHGEDHRLLGYPLIYTLLPSGQRPDAKLIAFGPKDAGPKWEPLET